jgi:uncharacterized protein
MGKVLLLLVIAAIVIAWFRARARKVPGDQAGAARPGAHNTAQAAGPERMVSCAQCRVHLPASEAVFDAAGTPFCGAPHLEAARSAGRGESR